MKATIQLQMVKQKQKTTPLKHGLEGLRVFIHSSAASQISLYMPLGHVALRPEFLLGHF
jgi:hypothetical protein